VESLDCDFADTAGILHDIGREVLALEITNEIKVIESV
jgi:HD superfamily phosphodiesterase